MVRLFIFLTFLMTITAGAISAADQWVPIRQVEVAQINADLVDDLPRVDVALYYASNLDEGFKQATPLDGLLEEFKLAKKVFAKAGVQLNLVAIKSGYLDPQYFSIMSAPLTLEKPDDGYVNMYDEMARHPSQLTEHAKATFEAIITPDQNSENTVHLVAMQGVYMPYYEGDEVGRVWRPTLVRTKGLSFPSYIHGDSIPRPYRGVITLSHHDSELKRTIAHELGHKLMNVSHEYKEVGPQHETFADGGLMLYGKGLDIPSGEEGRWHKERLHLSPFVYRLNETGEKVWNQDYQGKGFYDDPIYGDKVIRFKGPR